MGYDWLSYYMKRQKGSETSAKKHVPKQSNVGDVNDTKKSQWSNNLVNPFICADLNVLITQVFKDFKQYVESGGYLCKLKNIFTDTNYSDVNVQQLYLLRYVYAYAFENKEMFSWVIEDRGNCNKLSVESLGCGCLVDAWSLKYAANELRMNTNSISHTGVDLVEWNYRLNSLGSKFVKTNVADYFESKKTLDSEVYIFPRSIGDFNDAEFEKVRKAFATKEIRNSTIYLLISKIKGATGVQTRVTNRSNQLFKAIRARQFDLVEEQTGEYSTIPRIKEQDLSFAYPFEIQNYLKSLKQIGNHKENREGCDCSIDYQPMLKKSNLCYNVMKFERK